MRFTDEKIKQDIVEWVHETHQRQIKYLIAFCIGYYGCITKQIWRCITDLEQAGVVTWEV